MSLYDRIKRIADDKNMSIAYIEENANISNGSIAKWKQNTPKADNLYKVAKILGCTVEFLLTETIEDITFSNFDSNYFTKENIHDYKLVLNENEIEILNILRKFKDYRNQVKFIARAEALADEMLANLDEGRK